MVPRQSILSSRRLGHPPPPPLGGVGTTSYTAEQLCGGTLATDVAVGGRIREEGGIPPLVERQNTTEWMTPAEATDAAMAEAQEWTDRGGGRTPEWTPTERIRAYELL